MPLNLLFSSFLPFWLGYSYPHGLWQIIAFLEPSDAADAELRWMVKTFHRTMHSEDRLNYYLGFFTAVLTYVSSTEQSRRSQVPLTAAVIYAMHTIRSALDQGGIESLFILPGTVSTSSSVPMTFCQVDGIEALDLWSDGCIQLVKDLLQWRCSPYWHHDFQLALIAALYIDSTMQAHSQSTFADLLKYTSITDIQFRFSGAYDQGKLAVYLYMAVSQKPLDQGRYPLKALYDVIENTIAHHSILQLSGLRILEIAVMHIHKTTSPSPDWFKKLSFGFQIITPSGRSGTILRVNCWALLHLETLLAPQLYLLPEEMKELTCPDNPEKVHIAKARLALYDSLAKAELERAKGPKPDPELLRVFLWSADYGVCTHAFKWCLDLVPFIQPSTLGDANSTMAFIPEAIGYEWVEHFIHVICNAGYVERATSWRILISDLGPKWTTLPSSWCCDFASAFIFSIVQPLGMHGLPAYQCLAEQFKFMPFVDIHAFLPFLATMLELIKSSLTWARLTSFENWLALPPGRLENQDAYAQMARTLATRKQELVEGTLLFFAELPMDGAWTHE